MHRRKLANSQSGFTLIEALLQLLLFVAFCQFIGLIFLAVAQMGDATTKRMEADWEIAIAEINDYLINVKAYVAGDHQSIYFKSDRTPSVWRIRYVGGALILVKNEGVETIISGIRQTEFYIIDQELVIEVVLQSGEKRARRFVVDPVWE